MLTNSLLQQLNIQPNRAHKEVDVIQALLGHISGECLGYRDGIHDTVLDSKNKSLLLISARANANGGQELPDVDVLSRDDSAGENVRESGLQVVEEAVECSDPKMIVSSGYSSDH
jgi:hypothetical protein